jgi:hypothetical protein
MSVADVLGPDNAGIFTIYPDGVVSNSLNTEAIVTSAFQLTRPTTVGFVLTSDAAGNGTWASGGGGGGPTSELISPVTVFGGLANTILTLTGGPDPLITPVHLNNGEVLIGSTPGGAVPAALTAGGNILITNGSGSISVAVTPSPSFANLETLTLEVETGAVLGYVLTCLNLSGLAGWRPLPSVAPTTVVAGPSGNITVTLTAPNTYQVDIKSSPVFTGTLAAVEAAFGSTGQLFIGNNGGIVQNGVGAGFTTTGTIASSTEIKSPHATITGLATTSIGANLITSATYNGTNMTLTNTINAPNINASALLRQAGLDVVTTSRGAITYSGVGSLTYNGPSVVITTPLITGAPQSLIQAFSFNNTFITGASIIQVSIQDYTAAAGFPIPVVLTDTQIPGNCAVNVFNASTTGTMSGTIDIGVQIS